MNVISTNCAGSYIMTRNGGRLGNPFSWAFTPYKSIRVLLDAYHKIQWHKFQLIESTKWKSTYAIVVDSCIEINYIHYHLNLLRKEPACVNHDISSNDIYKYVVDRYVERTKRMLASNEPPRFLILQNKSAGDDDEFIELYNDYHIAPYNICWGTYNRTLSANKNTVYIGENELPISVINRLGDDIAHRLFSEG